MDKPNASLLYSALAVTSIVGSFFLPYLSVANGQSPKNMMSMMNGNNETDMSQNMAMPQMNMGIVTMPVACTSLGELLGSITGMTGAGGGNESQQNIMDMMQKMVSGGMGSNMTEADMQEMHQAMNMKKGVDMQHIMNMQFCSLMTDEKMAEEMLMKNSSST